MWVATQGLSAIFRWKRERLAHAMINGRISVETRCAALRHFRRVRLRALRVLKRKWRASSSAQMACLCCALQKWLRASHFLLRNLHAYASSRLFRCWTLIFLHFLQSKMADGQKVNPLRNPPVISSRNSRLIRKLLKLNTVNYFHGFIIFSSQIFVRRIRAK